MKKKILIIVIAIILIVSVVLGFLLAKDYMQEKILIEEIQTLTSRDITEDDFDTPIKTTGNYAVVEKAIKTYLNDYSTELKKVIAVLEDEKFVKILTVDNYKEDGPDFTNTKEYISTTKTQFNESMELIKEKCSKEKIMEQIQKENLDQKYVELYESLMLDEELEKDLVTQQEELEKAGEQINKLIDVYEKVIDFLVDNKGKWEVSGNMIQFETNKLVDQFNELTAQIQ